jgi:hypothetical protein
LPEKLPAIDFPHWQTRQRGAKFAAQQPKKERVMKTNEGGIDRIVRIIAGAVLLGLMYQGTIGVWGWIGVVPLATGLVGWCPLYSVLGMNTCTMKKVI